MGWGGTSASGRKARARLPPKVEVAGLRHAHLGSGSPPTNSPWASAHTVPVAEPGRLDARPTAFQPWLLSSSLFAPQLQSDGSCSGIGTSPNQSPANVRVAVMPTDRSVEGVGVDSSMAPTGDRCMLAVAMRTVRRANCHRTDARGLPDRLDAGVEGNASAVIFEIAYFNVFFQLRSVRGPGTYTPHPPVGTIGFNLCFLLRVCSDANLWQIIWEI
jgi:hypothetical protein